MVVGKRPVIMNCHFVDGVAIFRDSDGVMVVNNVFEGGWRPLSCSGSTEKTSYEPDYCGKQ
jgi:hypothetical protein